ncbi:MAG: UDP-N-acetylglucosamine 2-epimerase [Flavobacterium sp.]|nr:UDP-N-acetylglucosamine 2-epimerase [Flavobacterium sp.]
MKNYYFLIGTNAEFIKVFPVMVEMEKRKIPYKIISTGQNNLSNSDLFTKLSHQGLDYTFNSQPTHQTTISLLSWWIKSLFVAIPIFRKIKSNNTYLILHGDTISTFLGALLGKLFGFKLIHIEAGLRSFNYFSPFPEEINRVLVSNFVDIHFAQNSWAINNLKEKKGQKVNTRSNTLVDSLQIALENHASIKTKLPKKYFVFIFHRQENLANPQHVKKVINQILVQAKSIRCLFILHGNTMQTLQSLSLFEKVRSTKNITLMERVPYLSFMKILSSADFLITDGGSNQEEAFYLGLPIFILREHTERTEGLNENVILGGKNIEALKKFFTDYHNYRRPKQISSTSPSKIIVDFLEKT